MSIFEVDSRKQEKGWIYYIKVGKLWKVGITKNLKARIRGISSKHKETVDLLQFVETDLYTAWLTEQRILFEFEDRRIYSRLSTELFKEDIGVDLNEQLSLTREQLLN